MTQFDYVASSWDECGLRDAPRATALGDPRIDRCGGPCEDGSSCGAGGASKCADGVACTTTYTELCPENAACVDGFCDLEGDPIPCDQTCYYALGVPAACPSGAGPCGSGGRGLCSDTPATQCLFDVCADGSVCTDGLCGDGAACDALTAECPGAAGDCGDGGPALCGDGTTPCFRPKGDRARWRFATGGTNIPTSTLASCDPDPVTHVDYLLPNPTPTNAAIGSRNLLGLHPQPVGNDCLYIGSRDHHFYAFDEDSLPPHQVTSPTPTPVPPGIFAPPAAGACLWHWDTEGEVLAAKPAVHPDEDRIFIGSLGHKLWDLRRYPRAYPAPRPRRAAATTRSMWGRASRTSQMISGPTSAAML